jgi:hypothetical protein
MSERAGERPPCPRSAVAWRAMEACSGPLDSWTEWPHARRRRSRRARHASLPNALRQHDPEDRLDSRWRRHRASTAAGRPRRDTADAACSDPGPPPPPPLHKTKTARRTQPRARACDQSPRPPRVRVRPCPAEAPAGRISAALTPCALLVRDWLGYVPALARVLYACMHARGRCVSAISRRHCFFFDCARRRYARGGGCRESCPVSRCRRCRCRSVALTARF